MIEVTTVTVDGKAFLGTLKVLEPDLKWQGVGVHIVAKRILDFNPDAEDRFRALGLRQVHYAPEYHGYFYTQTLPAIVAKSVEFITSRYWEYVWWLYTHARLFQEIPLAEQFSWRYFSLFYPFYRMVTWLKRLR
jgi:hypothetical protein